MAENMQNPQENISPIADGEAEQKRVISLDAASPSIRSIARVIVIALLLVFIGMRIERILGALTFLAFLVFVSVFFAYLLDPLVQLVRRPFKARNLTRWMPRSAAIVIAYFIVLMVVGLGISYVAPRVVQQGREFSENIPAFTNSIRQNFNELNRRFDRLRIPEEMQTRLNDQASIFGQRLTESFGSFVFGIVTYLPWLVIVPILSFFFLKDVDLIRRAIIGLFPAGRLRIRADAVLADVNTTLAAYTRAQLLSMLFIGVMCTIGFYVIGLRYALLLGILAGVFEFVPLLGPLVIGIVATSTAAFGEDPRRAIWVAGFLIVLRVFHDYVSYPRIIRGGIRLHPLLIILSVLAGEQAGGIAGVFIAIPIVAVFAVVYRHILEHRGSRVLFEGIDGGEVTSGENA